MNPGLLFTLSSCDLWNADTVIHIWDSTPLPAPVENRHFRLSEGASDSRYGVVESTLTDRDWLRRIPFACPTLRLRVHLLKEPAILTRPTSQKHVDISPVELGLCGTFLVLFGVSRGGTSVSPR